MNSQNRGRKTPQTRKGIIMKKSTMNAIAAVLASVDFENKSAILDELNAEINKGADKRAAKVAEYENVKEIILAPLDEAIMTVSELYEAVKDELPEGFTRGKVQYALTKLYADEVVKHEGKPCTYGRKA